MNPFLDMIYKRPTIDPYTYSDLSLNVKLAICYEMVPFNGEVLTLPNVSDATPIRTEGLSLSLRSPRIKLQDLHRSVMNKCYNIQKRRSIPCCLYLRSTMLPQFHLACDFGDGIEMLTPIEDEHDYRLFLAESFQKFFEESGTVLPNPLTLYGQVYFVPAYCQTQEHKDIVIQSLKYTNDLIQQNYQNYVQNISIDPKIEVLSYPDPPGVELPVPLNIDDICEEYHRPKEEEDKRIPTPVSGTAPSNVPVPITPRSHTPLAVGYPQNTVKAGGLMPPLHDTPIPVFKLSETPTIANAILSKKRKAPGSIMREAQTPPIITARRSPPLKVQKTSTPTLDILDTPKVRVKQESMLDRCRKIVKFVTGFNKLAREVEDNVIIPTVPSFPVSIHSVPVPAISSLPVNDFVVPMRMPAAKSKEPAGFSKDYTVHVPILSPALTQHRVQDNAHYDESHLSSFLQDELRMDGLIDPIAVSSPALGVMMRDANIVSPPPTHTPSITPPPY
ncbi:hypothetical protein PCE1_003534 [Barthelona sp. PCE]